MGRHEEAIQELRAVRDIEGEIDSPAKADEPEYWESHVFWAKPTGGRLEPRDENEIKAVALLSPEELETTVHARMRSADIGGFQYRVLLQDAALDAARQRGLLPPRRADPQARTLDL